MPDLHRLRPLGGVLLAVLAALSISVAVLAMRHARPEPAAVASLPSDSPTGSSASSSAQAPTGSGTPTSSPTTTGATTSPAGATGFRTLVAVNGDVAWRTSSGSCAQGGGTVEVSADAGKTWRPVATTLDRVVRVQPTSDQQAFIVGSASQRCSLAVETTENAGQSWSQPQSVAGAWARDLAAPATLHIPNNGTVTPCGDGAVVDFARVDTQQVVVLCADGSIRRSADSGGTFSEAGTVSKAAAVAVDGERLFAFAVATGQCTGIQVSQVGGAVRSCVSDATGPLAASVTPEGAWLWIGEGLYRSTDDLATWQKAN